MPVRQGQFVVAGARGDSGLWCCENPPQPEGVSMSARECPDRWLSSLRGQVVTFTGVVNIDGRRLFRSECEKDVRKAGGSTATDFSG